MEEVWGSGVAGRPLDTSTFPLLSGPVSLVAQEISSLLPVSKY